LQLGSGVRGLIRGVWSGTWSRSILLAAVAHVIQDRFIVLIPFLFVLFVLFLIGCIDLITLMNSV
jgi:hypothetical protein